MTLVSLFNFALIVLGFGLLIFVHELGHFLAAKWAGIRAESFAVGMGPVLLSWRKGVGLATVHYVASAGSGGVCKSSVSLQRDITFSIEDLKNTQFWGRF